MTLPPILTYRSHDSASPEQRELHRILRIVAVACVIYATLIGIRSGMRTLRGETTALPGQYAYLITRALGVGLQWLTILASLVTIIGGIGAASCHSDMRRALVVGLAGMAIAILVENLLAQYIIYQRIMLSSPGVPRFPMGQSLFDRFLPVLLTLMFPVTSLILLTRTGLAGVASDRRLR